MRQLIWFRTDLRVQDNSALAAAMQAGATIALFIITPGQWLAHDDAASKVDFWLRNLRALQSRLAQLNVRLFIRPAEDWDEVDYVFDRTSVAEDVDVHLREVEQQLRQVRVAFDNITGALHRRLDKVKHNAAGYMAAYAPMQPSKDGEEAMRLVLELLGVDGAHFAGPIQDGNS